MSSNTFLPNTMQYFDSLLVFDSPDGSPNTSKVRKISRGIYFTEKCLIA